VGDDHAVACFARRGSSGGGGALESPGPAQGLTLRFANSHEPAWIMGRYHRAAPVHGNPDGFWPEE
jgi:hypothetical protein